MGARERPAGSRRLPRGAPVICIRDERQFGPPFCAREVLASGRPAAAATRDEIERPMQRRRVVVEPLGARSAPQARGPLLRGPPGTGKTHKVHYLAARLTGPTVILLTGRSIPVHRHGRRPWPDGRSCP